MPLNAGFIPGKRGGGDRAGGSFPKAVGLAGIGDAVPRALEESALPAGSNEAKMVANGRSGRWTRENATAKPSDNRRTSRRRGGMASGVDPRRQSRPA
jgi:hypothetical protein